MRHSKSGDESHNVKRQPFGMCMRIARRNFIVRPLHNEQVQYSRDRFHHASSNSALETVEAVPRYIKDWMHAGLSTGLYFIYLFIFFLSNKQHLH